LHIETKKQELNMNNAIFSIHRPKNEPVLSYAQGSPERIALEKELKRISSETVEIPVIVNGQEIRTGRTGKVVMPHNHKHILATYHMAGEKETREAIEDDPLVGRAVFHNAKGGRIAFKEIPLHDCCSHDARAEQKRSAGRG
jgi:delta 1-pyrroline-5-carboxylate dehydrogenase